MPVEIAAVSYVLSAIASVGKILESVQKLGGDFIPPERMKEIVGQAEAYGAEKLRHPPSPETMAMARRMSDEILDSLRRAAENAKDVLVRTYPDIRAC